MACSTASAKNWSRRAVCTDQSPVPSPQFYSSSPTLLFHLETSGTRCQQCGTRTDREATSEELARTDPTRELTLDSQTRDNVPYGLASTVLKVHGPWLGVKVQNGFA